MVIDNLEDLSPEERIKAIKAHTAEVNERVDKVLRDCDAAKKKFNSIVNEIETASGMTLDEMQNVTSSVVLSRENQEVLDNLQRRSNEIISQKGTPKKTGQLKTIPKSVAQKRRGSYKV